MYFPDLNSAALFEKKQAQPSISGGNTANVSKTMVSSVHLDMVLHDC